MANLLSIRFPLLLSQWHPIKNGNLKLDDFGRGGYSRKIKVWWKCNEGHEWESTINNRKNGRGCPYCSNKKVSIQNSLAFKYPKIAKQWHPTKNGNKTPNDYTSGSQIKVWWKCPVAKDHEWQSTICSRTINGNGGCSCCDGRTCVGSTCLAGTHPHLVCEWDCERNGKMTPYNVVNAKDELVWWKCKKGHSWDDSIRHRKHGRKCPYCSGKRVCDDNSLAINRPDIAKQWHPTKNGNKTPNDCTCGSNIKVWWKCGIAEDHQWKTSINHRTNGKNCPCCENLKCVKSNCLATMRPDIALEWDYDNNIKNPQNVVYTSAGKFWWKCKKGHSWKASLDSRNGRNTGCPVCRESTGEKLIRLILKQSNLEFNSQVTFDTCRDKGKLKFDFGIKKNNKILLIEYQGKQHYERFWQEKDNIELEGRQHRDAIKLKWCEDNKIPLLIIPYWEKANCEVLIKEFLCIVKKT